MVPAGGAPARASETTTPPYKKARSASSAASDSYENDNTDDDVPSNEWTPVHFRCPWKNENLQRGITLIIHMPSGDLLDYQMRVTCDGKCWKFECEEQLPPKMHKPKELLAEALGVAHPAAVASYEEELARLRSRSDEEILTKFSIKLNFEVQEQIIFSRMLKTKSHQRILVVQLLAPDTNYMAKPDSKESAEVDD